jgi:hypothetical protein
MMKAKVLLGMLCIGFLSFTACDKEDEFNPAPAQGVSSDNSGMGDPQPSTDVSVGDASDLVDGGKMADERINIDGRYFISLFEDGTPAGSVDVTSQYQGYVFSIQGGKLTVEGNGLELSGNIFIDVDRRLVEIVLPANERLSDIDQFWMLNELSPGVLGMASMGMDAPRDGMILTKM